MILLSFSAVDGFLLTRMAPLTAGLTSCQPPYLGTLSCACGGSALTSPRFPITNDDSVAEIYPARSHWGVLKGSNLNIYSFSLVEVDFLIQILREKISKIELNSSIGHGRFRGLYRHRGAES